MGKVAAVALSLAVVAVGCTGKSLDDEWVFTMEQEANQPLRVVDFLPQPGTPGVPKQMEPYFFFNKSVDFGALDFQALDNEQAENFQFDILADTDSMGLRYIPQQDWSAENSDGQLLMSVAHNNTPLVSESEFYLPIPEGRYYNASTDLVCTRFGGDPAHAEQLNNYMEPGIYPLYILFAEGIDDVASFPASLNIYIAPGYVRDNGQLKIYKHVGFTTPVKPAQIDEDGYFVHQEDGTFFPLDTPEGVLLLYLEQVRISGRFKLTEEGPQMTEMEVFGVLPTRFLRILSESSVGYSIAVSLLDLDSDLNGNGAPDSATFAVSSHPTLLEDGDIAK